MRTVMMCLVSFLFAGLASAQQPQPQDQPSDLQGVLAPQPDKPKLSTGACKNEVEKFCKDAEKGKIGDCLKQHEADLTAECKDARKKMHKMHQRMEKRTEEAAQPATAPAPAPAPAQQ